MNILIVLTSHDKLGDTEHKTGFWLEEFASPYYTLLDAGASITLASPKGGLPPLDPNSDAPDFHTEATNRFKEDAKGNEALANTVKLSSVKEEDFDAIMYPGGHGPLWDLTNDKDSISLIQAFVKANKPVASVCHAPSVLVNVKLENGDYLVKGKNLTAFSNTEEEAVQLTNVVPFLLEDELISKGANYSKVDDWNSYAITDGKLITGQNPASSQAVAKELLKLLS
ncbi:type 1 glutamine amidotransferase domain-containing protein [Poseidonibacter ostreae]|jgi:putative intracellular protease/amidase|uniref:Type 1 glutamine amidotransferase domain-containing protein n=1 Tax=Poseidonibacter ostreae TaxID=2654171 RepID=A0A6L4WVI5_9BACT|nr:type 1 glutamine amidotransferase domain-containing protein [Poseidonibacter ostreae]KAB7886507.1 type 1 glutamine amidotransferase domain-containing protein [Poseidonibacter ostreae]KAB7890644.1 type 1 glutamine amidotransferase domain-containing protein [Poseidonibacter ostreae]KAB7892373.1 type 1 glutamine amidotransferase domain-containing protein [Poseidonibacter ostreae]